MQHIENGWQGGRRRGKIEENTTGMRWKSKDVIPVCHILNQDNKSIKNNLILVILTYSASDVDHYRALSRRDPVDSVDVPMWVPSDHRPGRITSGCWHGVVSALYRHPTAVPHRRNHVRYVTT